jgi:hypothetical protein
MGVDFFCSDYPDRVVLAFENFKRNLSLKKLSFDGALLDFSAITDSEEATLQRMRFLSSS